MKKPKILSFSEYRIENALYIQKRLYEANNVFNYSFEFQIAKLYVSYLRICGVDKLKFVEDLIYLCHEEYSSYDKNIADNIVDIMDHIMDSEYLFKNYCLYENSKEYKTSSQVKERT